MATVPTPRGQLASEYEANLQRKTNSDLLGLEIQSPTLLGPTLPHPDVGQQIPLEASVNWVSFLQLWASSNEDVSLLKAMFMAP